MPKPRLQGRQQPIEDRAHFFRSARTKRFDPRLSLKAHLPSWSLIADICSSSQEVGFLPDFLAPLFDLKPIDQQPLASKYRMLTRYKTPSERQQKRLGCLLKSLMDSLNAGHRSQSPRQQKGRLQGP